MEVRSFMSHAGVRIVEGVCDAGVVVFRLQVRNDAGGADDILGYVFEASLAVFSSADRSAASPYSRRPCEQVPARVTPRFLP